MSFQGTHLEQLGMHDQAPEHGDYFDDLLAFLHRTEEERFIRVEYQAMPLVDDNPNLTAKFL